MSKYTKSFDIVVNPTGSKFAKALQSAIKERVTNNVWRRTAPKVVRTIISRKGNVLRQGYIREHFAVTPRGMDKIEQLSRFQRSGVTHPAFCLSPNDVAGLGSKTVFARTLVNATNGRGIIEFEVGGGNTPPAPLYTAYIPKKAEYRFHVFGDKVIDIQEKRKKKEFNADERNTRVRNVNNGYVYCRDGITVPDGASDLAIKAVNALGYKYGAVDLIYNEKRNQCYVLEVNSRPGLMGTTLEKYADAIIDMYNLNRK